MKLSLLLGTLALALGACVTTDAGAAPRFKQCTDGTRVQWNKPCPTASTTTTTQPAPVTTEPVLADPVVTEPIPTTTEVPVASVDPAPEPTVPDGYLVSPSLDGLPEVDDGLDINALTIDVSQYAHKTAAPDVVGAFRMDCMPGKVTNDDSIVYPNQPGKAHTHNFYGNEGANASSTFASLRTTGAGSCLNELNRSGYWAPAPCDPVKGICFRVDHTKLYYKRRPASDPLCSLAVSPTTAEGDCIPMPSGLKMIFGYDMVSGETPKDSFYWMCSDGTFTGVTVKPLNADYSHKDNARDAMLICPVGARLSASLKAASCWDGKYLDTPNHRDHMAYMVRNSAGFNRCPADHPYVIPGITLMQVWNVTAEFKDSSDKGQLYLSSDLKTGAVFGSTYHGDFVMAWNRTVHLTFVHNCIDKLYSCSSGDLGNGRMLKDTSRTKFPKEPQVVPMPPMAM